jgi:hypothetical protein
MKAIKQSAGDALCGKFLALRQGYIKKMNSDEGEDDFLRLLFQAQLQSRLLSAQQMMLVNSLSSSPIMNRGYYCRYVPMYLVFAQKQNRPRVNLLSFYLYTIQGRVVSRKYF